MRFFFIYTYCYPEKSFPFTQSLRGILLLLRLWLFPISFSHKIFPPNLFQVFHFFFFFLCDCNHLIFLVLYFQTILFFFFSLFSCFLNTFQTCIAINNHCKQKGLFFYCFQATARANFQSSFCDQVLWFVSNVTQIQRLQYLLRQNVVFMSSRVYFPHFDDELTIFSVSLVVSTAYSIEFSCYIIP